jgi:hypothetical protein
VLARTDYSKVTCVDRWLFLRAVLDSRRRIIPARCATSASKSQGEESSATRLRRKDHYLGIGRWSGPISSPRIHPVRPEQADESCQDETGHLLKTKVLERKSHDLYRN